MSQGEADFIIDEWTLIRPPIASGNSSIVWEVSTTGDPTHMAMKLLLPEAHADLEQLATLKHEGKIGKSLDHPNLIKFHKVVATKKHAYIIMDYFRAPNLKVQIGSDLTSVQARLKKMVEGICLALGYMHEKGLVHRDIKPDNILLSKSSELRLVDFSLSAKRVAGIGALFSGKPKTVQGTRSYIAPETIQKQHASPQTDIYSLGVTLFEILTGVVPFRGANPNDLLRKHVGERPVNPSELNPNVTPEMDKLVQRMLAKKPADRHKTMDELFAEFRSLKVFKEDPTEMAERRAKELAEKNADTFDGQRTRLSSKADHARSGAEPAAAKTPAAAPAAAAPAAPAAAPKAAPPKAAPAAPGQGGAPPRPAAPAPAAGQRPPMQPGAMPSQMQPGGPMQPPGAMPQPGRPPMPAGAPQGYPQPGYAPQGYPGAVAQMPGGPMPSGPMPGQAPYPQGYPQPYAPPQGYPQGYPPQGAPGQPMMRPPMPGAMPQGGPPQGGRPAAGPQGTAPRPGMPGAPQQAAPAPQRPPARPNPAPPKKEDELPTMDELPPVV